MTNEQPSSADNADERSEEAIMLSEALNEVLADPNSWEFSKVSQEKTQAILDQVSF